MKDKKRVYISGKALSCALGNEIGEIISCVRENKICLDFIEFSLLGLNEKKPYYLLKSPNVKRLDPTKKVEKFDNFFYGILFDTVSKAIADSRITPQQIEDMAIFFGSTAMDIPIYEAYYELSNAQYSDIFAKTSAGYGNIADETAEHFSIKGQCYTITTACTSSANCLIYAAAMIENGDIERALVIGYDLFSNLGFYGFESLKLLSPSPYKPFDKNRNGIILGEACSAVILTDCRNKSDDFYIAGGANTCDISNVAVHDTNGDSIFNVMTAAMKNAGITPHEVDAIKAHATGSFHNDLTECNAINKAFGKIVPPVTGIKPFIGHTVGAGGVVELVLFTESIKTGFIPCALGFKEPDNELNIMPVTQNMPIEKGVFLLNYFGFGGNSTTIIVSNKD